MITMAIDQSSTVCGFALFDTEGKHKNNMGLEQPGEMIMAGTVGSNYKHQIMRVSVIMAEINKLAVEYKVEQLVIEQHIYKTMHKADDIEALAHATAGCRFIAEMLNMPDPARLWPQSVRALVAKNGHATKQETAAATLAWWGVDESKVLDNNQTDAMAMAQAWLLR